MNDSESHATAASASAGHCHEDHGGCAPHHSGAGEADRCAVLTIRALSGISGDMMLAGLMRMNGLTGEDVSGLLASIMPELAGCLRLERASVNRIIGWRANVVLPAQHEHRTLADMEGIIAGSGLSGRARALALDCFGRVAQAEGAVHGLEPSEVHFHEVGALDSILDILLSCELYSRLAPARLVVSPLPVADGQVRCAHGVLPTPAPAVLKMLEGVPVRPFPAAGETVTPTGIALLLSFGAVFGPWPAMRVLRNDLVYGTRVFPDAPNGAIFALGEPE